MERVFLFLLFVAYSSSRSIPFRSVKSPDEIIYNYELVSLEISSRSSNRRLGEHPSTLSVSVKQGSRQLFALQLELNKNLVAPHFASVYTNSDGIQVSETHPNCFYHGQVNGYPKWQAVISTCHGLRGWFGDLNNENSLYHLEPLTDDHLRVSPEKDVLGNTHVLYKDTENKKKLQNSVCGTPHGNISSDRFKLPSEAGSSLHRVRRQSGGATNIVELLIVNDNNQYIAYGRNISAVVLRALEIFSHVDMLYQSINVRVVVVYSLTWTARQEISFSSVPNTLLTLFRQYHSTNTAFQSITHDSAQLITGIDLDGNTVGIAFVGTMCNYDSSVGLTQDTRGSVASVATIAAHEMGHTFGMNHDDASSCNCPDSNNGCIMNAVSRFPPATRWSQCSINELNAGFSGSGNSDLNRCLGNNPTTIVGTARCGNGIREPGETCDCGSVAECNDPCCNATTCELASTAQCSSGVCCENCRFKSYGTTCRNSSSMCDILEYCTGQNADCPTDVTRQNGVSCDSNTAYCYDGTCGSTRDQCNRYFGSVSVPSNDICYTQLNALGVGWGHCGADGTNYIACTTGNAFCGSLQCSGGSIIFNNVNSRSSLTAYTRYANNAECRSVTTRADADEVSPGLVVDGASCGTNMMCVNQRCLSVSSLSGVSPCPVGNNGQTCSGNGVCNNLNQCSCNVGYTGSDCSLIHGATTTTTTNIPTPSSSSSSTATSNTPSTATSNNAPSTSTSIARSTSTSTSSTSTSIARSTSTSTSSTSTANTPSTATSNSAAVGGAVAGVLILIILIAVVVVAIVLVVILRNKKSSNINLKSTPASGSRARYSRTPSDRKINVNGSHDDLLMIENSNTPPQQRVYTPYVPPSVNTVGVNRPPPPSAPQRPPQRQPPPPRPSNQAQKSVANRPPPPPPSRPSGPPPPPFRPAGPPPPPAGKPMAPPKPTAPPKPSTAPKPSMAPKPTTAPKPPRQWPPPSSTPAGGYVPPSLPSTAKKPIVPPPRK